MKQNNNSNAELVKRLGILAAEINMVDLEVQRDIGNDDLVAEKLERALAIMEELRIDINSWFRQTRTKAQKGVVA